MRSGSSSHVSRRKFLAASGVAITSFSIVPRSVLGGASFVAPSERITIAFIGVGSQGLRVMLDFLSEPDVQAVAVCDPNHRSDDYPQWGRGEFRNSVRRLLNRDSEWEWLSPDKPIRLTPTLTAFSGVAGRDPCQQIVNTYNGVRYGAGQYRGCAVYADFRELLEHEQDVDAVVIGTTDHLHAAVAIASMKKGKHVYCQKPMAHTVYEARRMAEVARETGVATQVAVGIQASEDTRVLREWIADGAIGAVRKVSNWSSRPLWPQALDRPQDGQAIPDGFEWNLWLGPAAQRPFHRAYLPFVWRGWYDFGSGALGDMGCYSFDTIFRALQLEAPTSVEATSSERYQESFPLASTVHYQFPARDDRPAVELTWYDGGRKPPHPDELEADRALDAEGLLFTGDRGAILCGFNGRRPRLIPESKMAAYQPPPKTLPRSPGTAREWLDACKGGGAKPGANFEFSAVVTEALLLGNVALQSGQRLLWDHAELKAVNTDVAAHIRPERRAGWEL